MKRRLPNPWIAIPALVGGVLAATIAYLVTDVSCRVQLADGTIQRCPVWSWSIGVVVFVGTVLGLMITLALVFRSIAESRTAAAADEDPPGPGCEVPDDQS